MKINLETLSISGRPYDNYLKGIRDKETKKHYNKYLHLFLREIEDSVYLKILDKIPDPTDQSRAEFFVKFCQVRPDLIFGVLSQYVSSQIDRVDTKEISPSTVHNYIKPIKVLLIQNDIPFNWKKIYKMYPREQKSADRAYQKSELQKMMKVATNVIDKVIITMFSSAGFRLGSWDYFTWADILIFKEKDGTIKGGAVKVYRNDPEEYWTHLTPEACKYIESYKTTWIYKVGRAPKPNDPFLRSPKYLNLTMLKQKGVRKRVDALAKLAGIRTKLEPGQKRYEVKLDHGFRKYFNTMCRRAKVDYLDKEDMMGHKTGLESSYERYNEEDFERFTEYQKAIPYLTISDEERTIYENKINREKIDELEKKNLELEEKTKQINMLAEKMRELESNGMVSSDIKEYVEKLVLEKMHENIH